jgi:hypothetical protein
MKRHTNGILRQWRLPSDDFPYYFPDSNNAHDHTHDYDQDYSVSFSDSY